MKIDLKGYAERHPALAARAGVGKLNARVRLPGEQKPGEAAELALYASLDLLGIRYERQYRWHPTRKWASDAAIPEHRLLIEIDGRAHIAGYDRFTADMHRRRAATFMGWNILAFTPTEAEEGSAALEVERWLKERA